MQGHGQFPQQTEPLPGVPVSVAVLICLALAVLSTAVPAAAQPAWVKPYTQGVAAFNAGNCEAAIPFFNEALAIDAETSPKKEADANDYRAYFPQNYLGRLLFPDGGSDQGEGVPEEGRS